MRTVFGKFVLSCAMIATACVSAISSASLIVENGPATSLSFRIGGPNSQAEAVEWLQATSSDTKISALIGSVDGNPRSVDAYLVKIISGDVIASTTVTVGSYASLADFTLVDIFSGLTLKGDFYRLTLFNTDTSGDTNVRWSVGSSTTNTPKGIFLQAAYSQNSDTNVTNPYLSTFTDSTELLGFQVTGIVPEPSSFALLGLGGIGLAVSAYRRRRAVV